MSSPVQAVTRAFKILECFATNSGPLTVDDVAQATGLPRATAYRLVHTLESEGYLHRDGKSFRLGKRVLGLGFAHINRRGFISAAQPVLDQLASQSGQTVVLGTTPQGGTASQVLIAAVAQTSGALSVVVEVGQYVEAVDTVLALSLESSVDRPPIHVGVHGAGDAVQALSVPIGDGDGKTIASLAIVMPSRRMTNTELLETYGDALRRAAGQLGY